MADGISGVAKLTALVMPASERIGLDASSDERLCCVRALWLGHSDQETRERQYSAAVAALIGIGPRDELEGMLAAQLLASHNAAMECYRRAMIPEQPLEGYRENLTQANKLSRTCALLLDALNRHRGKGQQKVTVEHVHVHQGGQAIVGAVNTGGGGNERPEGQAHEPQAISYEPSTPMRSLKRCADWQQERPSAWSLQSRSHCAAARGIRAG